MHLNLAAVLTAMVSLFLRVSLLVAFGVRRDFGGGFFITGWVWALPAAMMTHAINARFN